MLFKEPLGLEFLLKSGIPSTAKIGEKPKWDNKEIDKRTEELFEDVQKRWSF